MSFSLFSAKVCPFAQRVTLALQHLEIPHKLIEIDLKKKPEDYTKVNRAGKVPVLQIDSLQSDNNLGQPSSVFFPESLIILELLSDLFPGKILSEDPIKRAESRYFVRTPTIPAHFSNPFSFFIPFVLSIRALLRSRDPKFHRLHLQWRHQCRRQDSCWIAGDPGTTHRETRTLL